MKRILSVTEYIFKQSFRNKILNVLIIFAIFGIGFSLIISELAQEVEIKMVKDFGLFTIYIFSFLTLSLSIAIQMFEETELKTISIVLVKPIKRYEYVLGKFLGMLLTIFMNILIMFVMLMFIIKLRGGDPWDLKLILSVVYIFLGMIILTAVGLMLSFISTSVPSCIIFLFFTFVLGHLTVHLNKLAEQINNIIIVVLIKIIYFIFPNLELFNLKDKIYSGEGVFSLQYFNIAIGYVITYSLLVLIITTIIFNKKEY